jgi:hypothetical protein
VTVTVTAMDQILEFAHDVQRKYCPCSDKETCAMAMLSKKRLNRFFHADMKGNSTDKDACVTIANGGNKNRDTSTTFDNVHSLYFYYVYYKNSCAPAACHHGRRCGGYKCGK